MPVADRPPSHTPRSTRPVVSAADWVTAAAAVFAARGLSAIRVESLARDLGVTKGSFYWHFADRRALVSAVVQRWEREHTEAMITEAGQGRDPADQLHRLVAAVAAGIGDSPGQQLLYAEAEREGVGDALDRVTGRRIDYVRGLLEQLGQDPDEAERRAVLTLSASVGIQQLVLGAPQAVHHTAPERDRLVASLHAMLLS